MVRIAQSTKPISAKTLQRKWHIIDLNGQVLGRVANQIARLLMGKHKVTYEPHLDSGDYVIVLNAAKVEVTGKKQSEKYYQSFSGYPGGLTKRSYERVMEDDPEKIIRHAVSGMLPKNKLRDQRLARMHVSVNDSSPYMHRVTDSQNKRQQKTDQSSSSQQSST